MDRTTEEQTAGSATTIIDETYEFTTPQWYDLENEETKCDKQRSELWFKSATSSLRKSYKVESMCNFSQVEEESTQLKVIVSHKNEKKFNVPFVVDGDGLFLVTNSTDLVNSYPLAVLTPNVNEYKRLVQKVLNCEVDEQNTEDQLCSLAKQ